MLSAEESQCTRFRKGLIVSIPLMFLLSLARVQKDVSISFPFQFACIYESSIKLATKAENEIPLRRITSQINGLPTQYKVNLQQSSGFRHICVRPVRTGCGMVPASSCKGNLKNCPEVCNTPCVIAKSRPVLDRDYRPSNVQCLTAALGS